MKNGEEKLQTNASPNKKVTSTTEKESPRKNNFEIIESPTNLIEQLKSIKLPIGKDEKLHYCLKERKTLLNLLDLVNQEKMGLGKENLRLRNKLLDIENKSRKESEAYSLKSKHDLKNLHTELYRTFLHKEEAKTEEMAEVIKSHVITIKDLKHKLRVNKEYSRELENRINSLNKDHRISIWDESSDKSMEYSVGNKESREILYNLSGSRSPKKGSRESLTQQELGPDILTKPPQIKHFEPILKSRDGGTQHKIRGESSNTESPESPIPEYLNTADILRKGTTRSREASSEYIKSEIIGNVGESSAFINDEVEGMIKGMNETGQNININMNLNGNIREEIGVNTDPPTHPLEEDIYIDADGDEDGDTEEENVNIKSDIKSERYQGILEQIDEVSVSPCSSDVDSSRQDSIEHQYMDNNNKNTLTLSKNQYPNFPILQPLALPPIKDKSKLTKFLKPLNPKPYQVTLPHSHPLIIQTTPLLHDQKSTMDPLESPPNPKYIIVLNDTSNNKEEEEWKAVPIITNSRIGTKKWDLNKRVNTEKNMKEYLKSLCLSPRRGEKRREEDEVMIIKGEKHKMGNKLLIQVDNEDEDDEGREPLSKLDTPQFGSTRNLTHTNKFQFI